MDWLNKCSCALSNQWPVLDLLLERVVCYLFQGPKISKIDDWCWLRVNTYIFDACPTNVCCYSKPEHLQQWTMAQSPRALPATQVEPNCYSTNENDMVWFNVLPHPNQQVAMSSWPAMYWYICAMQHVLQNFVQGYFLTAFGVITKDSNLVGLWMSW